MHLAKADVRFQKSMLMSCLLALERDVHMLPWQGVSRYTRERERDAERERERESEREIKRERDREREGDIYIYIEREREKENEKEREREERKMETERQGRMILSTMVTACRFFPRPKQSTPQLFKRNMSETFWASNKNPS